MTIRRKAVWSALALSLATLVAGCVATIQAQSLPVTLHAEWSPNVATDQVTSYTVTLDGGTPQTVQASSCSTTVCRSADFSINDQNPHTVAVVAVNAFASSAPATTTFQVKIPSAPNGVTVKRS